MKCKGKQTIRFTNVNHNQNERAYIENLWNELTNLYGTAIKYYTNRFTLSAMDAIYGEQPTAGFSQPIEMLALAEVSNDSLLLSKFGIQSTADLVIVIPIKQFYEKMGAGAEPKSGDLVEMTELGLTRPGGGGNAYPNTQYTGISSYNYCDKDNVDSTLNGFLSGNGYNPMSDWTRGPNIFQVTQRRDQNIPQGINYLQGTYVWILDMKRNDQDYQPNEPRELGSEQVSDSTLYGKLSGGSETPEPPKNYDQSISKEAKKHWDYGVAGSKDGVYGDYT